MARAKTRGVPLLALSLCALFTAVASAQEGSPALPGLHFQAPTSQPAPSSQPSSQPASSQPSEAASQPSSQPSEVFRDRPINLLVYRHKKYPDGTDSKSIGLIYWHGIDPDSGWRLLAPFFFHYWDTTLKRDLWVLPAGLTYQNKENRTTLIGPVYQRTDAGGKDTVVFPIYWKSTASDHNYESLTIGPYYKRQTGTLTKSGVVPFAFATKDSATGARSLGVLPFFYSEREKDKRFVATLLGFYSQENQYNARGLIGPLYLSKESAPNQPRESTQALFPLWYRKKSGEGSTEQSWFVTLPGFYSHHWKEFTSTGQLGDGRTFISPLGFYQHSDSQKKSTAYFLNAFYSSRPGEYSVGVLPAFYRKKDQFESTTLTPLFYRHAWLQEPQKSLMISPFLWRYKTPEGGATGVLNTYATYGAGRWSFASFPVLFVGKRYDTNYAYLVPVLYHKKNEIAQQQTSILGPLYYKKDYDHYSAGIAPLLSVRVEKNPLTKERVDTNVMLFPVAQYNKRPSYENLIVGPFYRRHRYAINDVQQPSASEPSTAPSTDPSSLPANEYTNWIDHSDETNIGLFPIARYQHKIDFSGYESTRWSLYPVFAKGQNEANNRSWLYAFPYLGWQEDDKKLHSVLPLAWFWKKGEGESAKKLQIVLPLFVRRETSDVNAFVSLPYGAVKTNKSYTNWVGPAFWFNSKEKTTRGLLPIYFDTKASDFHQTIFVPFSYQYEDKTTSYDYLFGLYYHKGFRDEAGKTLYDQKILLPLFWREQDGDSLRMVVGPTRYRRDAQGYDFLLPPVYVRDEAHAKDAVVAPFFFYQKRINEGYTSEKVALLPFFGYGHGNDWRRLLTPVGFYSQNQGQERALFLNTFYWDHAESNGHGAFPLYIWRNDHETHSKTVGSLLFLRYRRQLTIDPSITGKFLVVGGLFWHGENLDRRLDDSAKFTYTYLLPFYYSYQDLENQTSVRAFAPVAFHKETKESSLTSVLGLFSERKDLAPDGSVEHSKTAILPVFWRENYPKQKITNLYAGPFISHKAPGDHWSYLAPLLFWQSRGEGAAKESRVVLAPFFGYTKGQNTASLITPLGVYQKNQEETKLFFVNSFYKKNKDVTSLGVVPFYFQRENAQEGSTSRVVFPFYAHYEKPVLGIGGPGEPLQSTAPGKVTSILGLYWHGENLNVQLEEQWGTRFTTIAPFYFWKEDKEAQRKALTVGPFFWRKFPSGYESGLFPLAFVGERVGKKLSVDENGAEIETPIEQYHQYIFPLYFHQKLSDGDSKTYAGLLFWYQKKGPDTKAWLLPVARYSNIATEEGQKTGISVFPVFRWESSPGRYQFDSLPLSLYKREETRGGRFITGLWEKGDDRWKAAFMPLFWFSETPEKKISYAGVYYHQETADKNKHTLLFPLFYSQWTYNGTRQKVLFPFGYYAQEPAIDSSALHILNFYATRSKEVKQHGVWPLWQSTKYTVDGKENSFSYLFPLYVRRSSPTEDSLITPLSYYYRVNNYRKYWVLPYYGTRAGESNKTDFIFPFFYRSVQGKEKISVAGPFYVSYEDPSLRVRVGLPLVLDIKTKKSTTQILTPLYIHTKGKKAERWRVALIWSYSKYDQEYFLSRGAKESELTDFELRLPPIFKYTRDNPQSYQWKALLGLVGFEKNVNKRRLFLFGIPIKLKDKGPS